MPCSPADDPCRAKEAGGDASLANGTSTDGQGPSGATPMDIDPPEPSSSSSTSSSSSSTDTPIAEPEPDPAEQAEALKTQGNVHFKAQRFTDAVRSYTSAIDLATSSSLPASTISSYLSNRAAALMGLKRYSQALADMQAATASGPANPKSLIRLARCYLACGQPYPSRATLTPLLTSSPPLDPPVLAEVKRELGRVDSLSSNLEKIQAARDRKDHSMVLIGLDRLERECDGGLGGSKEWRAWKVEALVGKRRFDEAATLASDLLRAHPADPEALYLRGMIMFHEGNLSSAIKHAQEALRCDPDFTKARTLLRTAKSIEATKEEGNRLFKAGDSKAAVEKYDEAIKLAEENQSVRITLLSNKAAALLKSSSYPETVSVADEILALDPKHFKALRSRGRARLAMEEWESATRDLEQAFEYAPVGSPDEAGLKREVKEAKVALKKSKQKDYCASIHSGLFTSSLWADMGLLECAQTRYGGDDS